MVAGCTEEISAQILGFKPWDLRTLLYLAASPCSRSRISTPRLVAARPPRPVSRRESIHEIADFLHGVDDLIGRDHALDSGERHVSGRHRVDSADDVAFHARYLDETGDRDRRRDRGDFSGSWRQAATNLYRSCRRAGRRVRLPPSRRRSRSRPDSHRRLPAMLARVAMT